MITRGHFIGEIVDELASVTTQIATRGKLGLFDLNVIVEGFFKDVLNNLYGWNLEGLNTTRANEPGLDLGDEALQIGVQVTSRSDAGKVNDMLKKISPEQAGKFKVFYVLVVGQKKGGYKLDGDLCTKYDFEEKRILDVQDLCRRALDQPIDRLQELHRIIRRSVGKVLIELEIPDPETGEFPTSGYDKWETKPEVKVGDGRRFAAWLQETYRVDLSEQEVAEIGKDLIALGERLLRLPRVTREFLVVLFERRRPSAKRSQRFQESYVTVLLDTVRREYAVGEAELQAELGLLQAEGLVEVNGECPDDYGPPEIGMCILSKTDELSECFLDYVSAKKLNLRVVLGQIDLSEF